MSSLAPTGQHCFDCMPNLDDGDDDDDCCCADDDDDDDDDGDDDAHDRLLCSL